MEYKELLNLIKSGKKENIDLVREFIQKIESIEEKKSICSKLTFDYFNSFSCEKRIIINKEVNIRCINERFGYYDTDDNKNTFMIDCDYKDTRFSSKYKRHCNFLLYIENDEDMLDFNLPI